MALEAMKEELLSKLPEWKAEHEKLGRFIEAAEALAGTQESLRDHDEPWLAALAAVLPSPPEDQLPTLASLWGVAPTLGDGLESVAFIRRRRDAE